MGVYGTLIGAGGGFVLVPLLLLFYPAEDAVIITSISLAVVFVNALSGSIAYARRGRIDYRSGVILAGATVPGAVLGVIVTGFIARGVFDLILGLLLIAASVLIFLFPPRGVEKESRPGKRGFHRAITERDGTRHEYSFNIGAAAGASGLVGFFSSLLGIGGGIIHVPLLARVFKFPVHVAAATSHFVLAVMGLTATAVNIAGGSFYRGMWRALFLSAGVLAGAQLGAFLSGKIKGLWILRALAVALAAVGVRLLFR